MAAKLPRFHDDMEPPPDDFDDVYARIGWGRDGIERHYQIHAIKAARWIDERGRERLKVLRIAFLKQQRRASAERRKRYVLGRTLSAVTPGRGGE